MLIILHFCCHKYKVHILIHFILLLRKLYFKLKFTSALNDYEDISSGF